MLASLRHEVGDDQAREVIRDSIGVINARHEAVVGLAVVPLLPEAGSSSVRSGLRNTAVACRGKEAGALPCRDRSATGCLSGKNPIRWILRNEEVGRPPP